VEFALSRNRLANTWSLDAPVFDEDDGDMYALLGDDGDTSSTLVGLSMLREAVEDVLTSLTARKDTLWWRLKGKRR